MLRRELQGLIPNDHHWPELSKYYKSGDEEISWNRNWMTSQRCFQGMVFVRSTIIPVKVCFKKTASLPYSWTKNRRQDIGVEDKEPS